MTNHVLNTTSPAIINSSKIVFILLKYCFRLIIHAKHDAKDANLIISAAEGHAIIAASGQKYFLSIQRLSRVRNFEETDADTTPPNIIFRRGKVLAITAAPSECTWLISPIFRSSQASGK
jgi:hypothetical protein